MKTYKHILFLLFVILSCEHSYAQDENDVIDMKDPITGKWGYASKIQNRKSPLKGIKKLAAAIFGKTGASLIDKSDAEHVRQVPVPCAQRDA